MKTKTETGLMLLLIYAVISVITTAVTYLVYTFIAPIETLVAEAMSTSILATVPLSVIGGIAGLLALIGAVLIFVGRKEFGEKHHKYVTYALFLIVIGIIVVIITTIVTAGLVFSYVSSSMPDMMGGEVNDISASALSSGFFVIFSILVIVSACVSNLIWVFGLYQLENDTGRRLLVAFYIIAIIVAIATAWNMQTVFSGLAESSFETSQYLSNYMWMGTTGLITLVGGLSSQILLVGAIYIPYKRIKNGELQPVPTQPSGGFSGGRPDRVCPNCGKVIPFDAQICPYCAKHFTNY